MNALMIAYFVVLGSVECVDGKTIEDTGQYICSIRANLFPTFAHFVIGAVVIGTPMLVSVGYLHYKKNQYGTHAHVNWRTNPYQKVTLRILVELIDHMKKDNPDKLKTFEEIQNKLNGFLKDKRLDDDVPPDDDFKNF